MNGTPTRAQYHRALMDLWSWARSQPGWGAGPNSCLTEIQSYTDTLQQRVNIAEAQARGCANCLESVLDVVFRRD